MFYVSSIHLPGDNNDKGSLAPKTSSGFVCFVYPSECDADIKVGDSVRAGSSANGAEFYKKTLYLN